MHQITYPNWPSVEDLYPHVGMSTDWPAECVPPAKSSHAASLQAPAAGQGGRALYAIQNALWEVFCVVAFFAPPAAFVTCAVLLVTK